MLAVRILARRESPSDKMDIRVKKSRGQFSLVLQPEPEGGFTAIVPVLPGCVTYGRTLAEAKKMAKDAIFSYIESLKKHGEPIPRNLLSGERI